VGTADGTKVKRKYPLGKYKQANTPEEYLNQRSKQLENGCIEFTAGKDRNGYGQCQASRVAKDLKVTRAHQMAYVSAKGPIPKGMFVCHTCDNPSCINPDHLFVGTPQDNVDDMMRKGRYVHPEMPRKLTTEQYLELMSLKGREHALSVADKFGVSWGLVYSYWRGEHAPKLS
jgi:hypothetical protein